MSSVSGPARCPWANGSEIYQRYHDEEWGRPLHGRDELFERICLESFQAGLSWITVLRKREAFREAFGGFVPEAVAAFHPRDVERLLRNTAIVRNRAKIEACVTNARAVLALDEAEGLDALLWSFAPPPRPQRLAALALVPAVTPESTAMARELKRRGLTFVGPTTAYALMQATGMVDDHIASCAVPMRN